jgi:hypothetical protein
MEYGLPKSFHIENRTVDTGNVTQRRGRLLHRKVPPFGVVRRVRCALSYCHRPFRCRASSFTTAIASRPLGRLARPAHSLVAEPAALANSHCRLAILLALDRVCGSLGLATRTPSLGSGLRLTGRSHSHAPAQLAGFTEERTILVRLVPHALELCEPGRNSPTTAWLARVGGNGAALVARP